MTEKPWYHQGLRFECTGCGDCCTGAPGYVWVNKEEIRGLAEQVGEENLERFEKMYVRQVGIRKSLKEYSDRFFILVPGFSGFYLSINRVCCQSNQPNFSEPSIGRASGL